MLKKVKLFASHELTLNSSRALQIVNQNILVVRTEAGVFALENSCPHQSRSLDTALIQDGLIRCLFHSVRIDPATGNIVYDSGYIGLQPVRTYTCIEEDGAIWLDFD